MKQTCAQVVQKKGILRHTQQSRQRATEIVIKTRLETFEQKFLYILVYFKCDLIFNVVKAIILNK